jgi:hypothetical protein
MLKFTARSGDGRPLLMLGITDENVARLKAGKPILVKADDVAAMGLPAIAVAIQYGATEQAILDDIMDQGVKIKSGYLPEGPPDAAV